jgi:hypothetical protein
MPTLLLKVFEDAENGLLSKRGRLKSKINSSYA